MIRFFVNLLATFTFVLLLVTPGVFSGNLVEFTPETPGVVIYENSEKFGNWAKLEANGDQFNLELTQFEKPAYFGEILTIENRNQTQVGVEIVNSNPKVSIFFDIGSEIAGPQSVKLASQEKVGISLLLPAGEVQTIYTSFSLKTTE